MCGLDCMLYFDHNATAPMLEIARKSWLQASEMSFGNPSSQHRVGDRAYQALEQARFKLAGILGCHALDLLWTSGATESNNTVFHHLSRFAPDKEVWISAIEHPCVMESAHYYFPGKVQLIPCLPSGQVDVEALKVKIQNSAQKPACIAVMAANNETGILQSWQRILEICQQAEIPYFCDAVQWIGRLPGATLGQCDYLSGCAHKFGGPKGVGFLKCPGRPAISPLLKGGPQQEKRRAGTENTPGIIAMVETLQWLEDQFLPSENVSIRHQIRNEFIAKLDQAVPGIQCLGRSTDSLWNTVTVIMPEVDCRFRWVIKMDRQQCAVSTGSACSSGHEKPSHVIRAMGLSTSHASRVLRFSSGYMTKKEEWNELLEKISVVYAQAKGQGHSH